MGQLIVLYLSTDLGMPLSHSAGYSSAVFAASVVGKVLPLARYISPLTSSSRSSPLTSSCLLHLTPLSQVGCGCGLDGPRAKWVGMAGSSLSALRLPQAT
jgi:hypothetical protein